MAEVKDIGEFYKGQLNRWMEKMRQCSKCRKQKDESAFGKNRTRTDGLRIWCKECESEYARKRYEKNRGSVKKYNSYEDLHRVVNGLRQKRCGRCKKWKAESQYYKHLRHKDGLAVWCKECSDKATNRCRRLRLAVGD